MTILVPARIIGDMSILVPIIMIGWIFLTIFFFFFFPAQKAVLFSVIGGVLFLPMALYDFNGLPTITKSSPIAIGLIIAISLSGYRSTWPIKIGIYDYPIIMWVFFSPMATSLYNGLGVYNGVSSIIQNYINWGIFYWVGRRFFNDIQSFRTLCLGIVIGALFYLPLCIYELRMSPQLSNLIYGFFPHMFHQHIRYDGFRPIIFMQHGLMVSLWMAIATTVSYWLWRTKEVVMIAGIPMGIVFISLFIITILCKSANGWTFLLLGLLLYVAYAHLINVSSLRFVFLLVPIYIVIRLSNYLILEDIQTFARLVFDEERIFSLSVRLIQENLFGNRALESPIFGWGGYQRGWPRDPLTGEIILNAVDSLWVIVFSTYGILGLISIYASMIIGPWIALKKQNRISLNKEDIKDTKTIYATVLSIVVIFFIIDSLLNGMINPIYILCAGALVNYAKIRERSQNQEVTVDG